MVCLGRVRRVGDYADSRRSSSCACSPRFRRPFFSVAFCSMASSLGVKKELTVRSEPADLAKCRKRKGKQNAPMGVTRRRPVARPPSRSRVVLPESLELLERKTSSLLDEEVDDRGADKVATGEDKSIRVADVAGDEGRKERKAEVRSGRRG